MLPILDNMPALTGDIEGQRQNTKNGVESADGGPFGDILNAQARPPAAESEADAGQEPVLNGGNVLQSGGKDLPAPSVPEPEKAVLPMTSPGTAAAVELLPNGAVPPVETLSIDETRPLLESLSLDKNRPLAAVTEQTANTVNPRGTPAETGPTPILPADQMPSAAADQTASAMAGQAAIAMAGQAAIAMTGQAAPASSAAKPVAVRAAETAIAGIAPDDANALSTLTTADEGHAGISRDNTVSHGRATPMGAQEVARLSRAVEPTARVDFAALDGVPAVAKEGSLLETADLLKGLEPTQVKQPAIAQTQSAAASIQMPASVTELPAGLKMSASATMATPLGDPNWHSEFSGRISLMVKNGMPEASLQLNPPELGRVEIKITTDGDQARIQFAVQGIDAKDAIEQAMPRLREMLEQSGLQLARSDVADHSQSRQGESHLSGTAADSATADLEENADESIREFVVSGSNSTVDYYV